MRPKDAAVRVGAFDEGNAMKALLAATMVMLSAGCTTVPDVQASSRGCEERYRVELPAGAVAAKPVSALRIAPQHGRRSAYACVIAMIDEHGRVTQSRLVETDWRPFGEYFLDLVARSRFHPATLNGKPFAHQAVLAASYE